MASRTRKGRVFVISAPSGAGKTTIVNRLLALDGGLEFSVSHTTRRPRDGEKDGVHYHFVSLKRFQDMVRGGEFLEWAEVHGAQYGTARREVERRTQEGRDVLLDIDLAGARQIRESATPATLVFILPPSYEELRARLGKRGTDAPEQIDLRLRRARDEIAGATFYDYLVVNGDVDRAIEATQAILAADRLRATDTDSERLAVLATFPEGSA